MCDINNVMALIRMTACACSDELKSCKEGSQLNGHWECRWKS